ncbi:MAG: hypothetical protein ACUZ8E_10740 [Candidatus Anammoxibacter sp.]
MFKLKAVVSLCFLLLLSTVVFADTTIKTFTGSGGKNTRPFQVVPGWEIQWDAKGDIFQLYLYTADGSLSGVPANQQGSGKGSSYQAKGGSYYLQVNAIGRWEINIIQINGTSAKKPKPDANKNGIIASFAGSGGKNTRPFNTSGPWEIQWDANGDIFQLYLYTADGSLRGVPANQQGSGKGTSYQPKAGKFYLQVNAIGSWQINIVPVK